MRPMNPMQEEEPTDDLDLEKAELGDLKAYARAGTARELAKALGKELPPELMTDEDQPPPEDPEIPGVEADPMAAEGGEGAGAEGGLPPELMEKLAAMLKAKGNPAEG